jgi:hypothetical protein
MKRKITLQEAYDLINKSYALIIDDDGLCYPSLYDLTGEAENEWLYCKWSDPDFNEFVATFIEEDQEILFDGSTITMKDSEDEVTTIKLLVPLNSEH